MQQTNLPFRSLNRLTRRDEFAQVRRDGRTLRGQLLTLGVRVSDKNVRWQAGFITSKRIGNAVARNRVRRRLREIVRLHQHAIREGVTVVTIARPAAAATTYRALEVEWLRLAGRASILRA